MLEQTISRNKDMTTLMKEITTCQSDDVGSSYEAELALVAEGGGGERKRERTRAKLKLATVELLREVGIGGLTVTGVTRSAGVADGTFYTHFSDLDELLREVLIEYFRPGVPLGPEEDTFDAIKNRFLHILRVFRRDTLIFKALAQLRGEGSAFREVWTGLSNSWARRYAELTTRDKEGDELDERFAIMLGHAASAMVDELLLRIYLDRFDDLLVFGEDDETIAELLTVFRYRLLRAEDPPEDKLTTVARSLVRVRTDRTGDRPASSQRRGSPKGRGKPGGREVRLAWQ